MKTALLGLPCLLLLALVLPLAWAENGAIEDPNDPIAIIKTSHGEIHVELFVREAPKTVENFLGLAEGRKAFQDPKTRQEVKRPYYDGLIFHRVIPGFMIQGGCPLGNGRGGPGLKFKFEDEIDAEALGLTREKVLQGGTPHPWLNIHSRAQLQQKVHQPLLASMGITSQEQLDQRRDEVTRRLEALTLAELYEMEGYRYQKGTGAHPPIEGMLAMANSGPNTNGSQFFINLGNPKHLTGRHTVFGKVIKGMDVVEKIGAVKTTDTKPVEPVKIISIRRRVN